MKNFNCFLLIVLFLFNTTLLSAQKKKEKKQLIIEGVITSEDIIVKNKKVLLFLADKIVESAVSNEYGSFKLNLEFGRTYYLVIGGEEYDMKWIKVCTRIPSKHRKENHTVQCYIEIEPRIEYTIIETYASEN